MNVQAAASDDRDTGLLRELWLPALVGFVAFRILVPLAVLAAAPDHMPLLPRYDRVYLNGDANGFYQAVSAFFAAFRTVMYGGFGVIALAAIALALVGGTWSWRRGWQAAALLLPATVVSIAVTLVLRETAPPGAAVIGWPLVWAATLFPLPALGLELTPDRAFPIGLALGLLANGVTTVATAAIGLRASGRRSVGLGAAGLYATWPVWVGLIAGHSAWENGQWNVDTGLHLYTEPLSTMLMVVAVAMLLGSDPGEARATGSGLALGFATVVKLTNGLIGLVLIPLVAVRYGLRKAALVAVGGLVSVPIVIVWWPKGYVHIYDGAITPASAYSLDYIGFNLRESTIFTPLMLVVLVLPALVGLAGIDGWFARSVLVTPVAVTALAYCAYFVTNQHPRFLYVALPFVFVLFASGGRLLVVRAHHLLRSSRTSRLPASIGFDDLGVEQRASLTGVPPSPLEERPASRPRRGARLWVPVGALVAGGAGVFALAIATTQIGISGADAVDRGAYCSVAGNTASDGSQLAPGTFLDLALGEPERNVRLTGAQPANFIQGAGLTCSAPPEGYARRGFASSADKVTPGIHPYYAPPGG